MARKLDKRQGGLFQRFGNWLAGTKPQTHEEAIISNVSNVGEYKAACAEKYGT